MEHESRGELLEGVGVVLPSTAACVDSSQAGSSDQSVLFAHATRHGRVVRDMHYTAALLVRFRQQKLHIVDKIAVVRASVDSESCRLNNEAQDGEGILYWKLTRYSLLLWGV